MPVRRALTEPEPDFATLPIVEIYIPTDGSLAAENRVRVQAANLVPNAIINSDRDPVDFGGGFVLDPGDLTSPGDTVPTAPGPGGSHRRHDREPAGAAAPVRTAARLRHAARELRQVVFLETAATMVLTSAVGVVLGMVLGYAATRRVGLTWTWPGPEVYAYAGGAVLAALILSTLALPLLNAATRFDAIRYE